MEMQDSIARSGQAPARNDIYLLGIAGPLRGKHHLLRDGRTHLGREVPETDEAWECCDQAAQIHDPTKTTSRSHAIVKRSGQTVNWLHMGSSVCLVSGKELSQGHDCEVKIGDEIRVGESLFRLCRGDDLDWSDPKKSGAVWRRIVLGLSLALGAVCVYVALQAADYLQRATARTPFGISAPKAASPGAPATDFGPLYNYAPAMVWLPQCRSCVIATVDSQGTLTATDGKNLKEVWHNRDEPAAPRQGLATADLDGNGVSEFLFSSNTGKVVAVDAGTGVYLWKSDFLEAGLLSPTVADLDGNGLPDVVAVSSRGSVFIGRNGKTGIKFERLSYRAEDFSVPAAVIDCDGDGKKEIVLVETRGQTIVLDGSQGTLTKTAAYPRAAIAKMDSSYAATADAYVLSSPAFVAGKGEKRCAMATVLRDPAVVALVRPPAGDPVWARNLSMAVRPDTASGPLYPAPVTADLNRDGHNDLVVALQAGPLLALDGRTGSLIWSYHEPSMWHRVYASPALYDFDKDGTVDAVFGEDAGGVHVVSGRTGASLGSSGPASSPVIGSLMVGDVDGDGKVDIAVQHADGTVRTYRTSSSAPTPASFWPMEGAGPARSGSPGPSGFRTDAKSAELATSTTVLFILLGLNWVLRPRRFSVLTPANAISVHAKPQSCQQDRPGPPAA